MSEFKPCLKSPKKQFQMSTSLNLKKLKTILSATNHIWASDEIWIFRIVTFFVAIICLESRLADTHYSHYRGLLFRHYFSFFSKRIFYFYLMFRWFVQNPPWSLQPGHPAPIRSFSRRTWKKIYCRLLSFFSYWMWLKLLLCLINWFIKKSPPFKKYLSVLTISNDKSSFHCF